MKLIQARLFMFLIMISSFVAARPNAPDQPVGTVLFATGQAYADQAAIQAGSPIYVGQILYTTSVGHLHIRMIDGAFLSLRPSSSAKVALYTVDLEEPANTQIRIDVQQGVVRSVTGKGGESNKSAFRLNTPVAAIGIRGTDFIVYTDAISSVVDLRQGGIEMTPFSDSCTPYTLGGCGGTQSVALLDRNLGLVAEVHAASQKAIRVSKTNAAVVPDKVIPAHPAEDQSLKQAKETPVVISTVPSDPKTVGAISDTGKSQVADSKEETSADNSSAGGTAGSATTSTKADNAKTPVTSASAVNSVASGSTSAGTAVAVAENKAGNVSVATSGSSNAGSNIKASALVSASSANITAASAGATVDVASIAPVTAEVGPKDSVTSELASRVISQATTEGSLKAAEKEVAGAIAAAGVVTTPTPIASVAHHAQPFYWGRWASYAENAEQNIVRDPARSKQVFAANTAMLLASTETGVPSLPKNGVVNFKQDKAEAHVLRDGALHDASVSNAALAVNFDQNHFSTSLDVSSRQLANGTEHLRATGSLDASNGLLRGNLTGSNMAVMGKVGDQAATAGYLFSQDATGVVGAVSLQAQ